MVDTPAVPRQRAQRRDRHEPVPGRPPLLPRSYVPRRRLGAALDAATRDGGITLLVAPAGAGKTHGVAGWLRDSRRHEEAVWVPKADTLTVDDLTYLTGLRDDAGCPRLVVIDDVHEMPPACTAWLDHELDRAPDALHLLLLSRWDLPLTRLVPELLGHLTVLRGSLLQLDEDETARLVAHHARNDSPQLAQIISARTKGWCAAVVLAAKALADRVDPVRAAQDLAANVGILDRVAGEAFAALSPRQRHVLLCVAAERVVTAAEATRLTNDPRAGRILEELESTGLHVTRYNHPLEWLRTRRDGTSATGGLDDPGSPEEPAFVVHPLLTELTRRRLTAGGVDVERARATVRRAVEQDLDRGDLSGVVRRLVTVGDHATLVRTLTSHGAAVVLSGCTREIQLFAHRHADVVEQASGCWFALALERWDSGDVSAAREWLTRISRVDAAGRATTTSPTGRLQATCTRVLRGCLGDEPLGEVVAEAEVVLAELRGDGQDDWPLVPLLELLLGTAQLRSGDLERAVQHLTLVADVQGGARSVALVTRATSQLALVQLIRGREHTTTRLTVPAMHSPAQPQVRAAGLDIAQHVAALHLVADTERPPPPLPALPEEIDDLVRADPVALVLLQVLRSRQLLVEGRAAEAERVLQAGTTTTTIPRPLTGTVLLEGALQALLTGDRETLRALAQQLGSLGWTGESALVDGFRADLSDDLARAATLFAEAARTATCHLPPAAAIALACQAQVLDALGRRAEASTVLLEAVTRSEVRRTLMPFLGWSRHGRPTAVLLEDLSRQQPTRWCAELATATANRSALTSLAGPMTATPQEQAHVTNGAAYVSLSPRERDVLHELARGSTYADIASNLFLSENTVKTHVSSVYSKLAVNRRSDALAVARTLHLV